MMPEFDDNGGEDVLVFPARLLKQLGGFQGLSFDTSKYLKILLNKKNNLFLRRQQIEKDNSYKQLIPYVILRHENNIFSYRRSFHGLEKRLANKYSIGLGGHITARDIQAKRTTYVQGLYREINEEIELKTSFHEKTAALINDDSDEVGKVHFGVVHIFLLDRQALRAKDKSIVESSFVDIKQLKKNAGRYENWSKLCITEIDNLLSQ